MTDDEIFCEAVADVAQAPMAVLRLADWEALPLTVRLADKLAEALIFTGELRTELANDDAASLMWIVPSVDDVSERLATILQRLAS